MCNCVSTDSEDYAVKIYGHISLHEVIFEFAVRNFSVGNSTRRRLEIQVNVSYHLDSVLYEMFFVNKLHLL